MGIRPRTVEDMVTVTAPAWRGRSVMVTGHTGFKGSWLTLWLGKLGAEVHGFSLEPPTSPNLFEVARVGDVCASDVRADLANLAALTSALRGARPTVVFHLAAQALVRESYRDPIGTFGTNVMGTANVLEAVRRCDSVEAVVVVTTDKVYENRESSHRYAECDPLGGRDPYSASKAAAEIVAGSMRSSFFGSQNGHRARVATARAGNVLGGADWAVDRLVPDCLRAFASGDPVELRFPNAVRPWQHVLEPLSGYLLLAERLCAAGGERFARAWNFGPAADSDATVGDVAAAAARLWGEGAKVSHKSEGDDPHEAGLLHLDSSLAHAELGWRPRWTLGETLARTVEWHRKWMDGADMADVSREQITLYERSAKS